MRAILLEKRLITKIAGEANFNSIGAAYIRIKTSFEFGNVLML